MSAIFLWVGPRHPSYYCARLQQLRRYYTTKAQDEVTPTMVDANEPEGWQGITVSFNPHYNLPKETLPFGKNLAFKDPTCLPLHIPPSSYKYRLARPD